MLVWDAIYKFLPPTPPSIGAVSESEGWPNLVPSMHSPFMASKYRAGALVKPLPSCPRYTAPPRGQTLALDAGSEPYEINIIGPLLVAVCKDRKFMLPSTNT